MNLPVVTIAWCKPIACVGLDASLIPPRAGIYEILDDSSPDAERVFMGESDDVRKTLIAHISGWTNHGNVTQRITEGGTYFRYWLCDSRIRRSEVAAALWDRYAYECGGDWADLGGNCVRLIEED